MILLLQEYPPLFVALALIVGLAVGSFLNVVIYRLPIILERGWRRECRQVLGLEAEEEKERFNLLLPGSRCPSCGHVITPLENIPVISYLLQRGRCTACGVRISFRYPAVELLTALMSGVVAWHFGFGPAALAGIFLTWTLIALAFIDVDHQILPDQLTLPVLWLGLGLSLAGVFVDSHTSIIGAVAGYLALWSVYHLFKFLTGKEGMGYGDFKLLALFGAWFGWQSLPLVILASSVVGAIIGGAMILFRGHDRAIPIPYGPYLAAAGWLTMLWGDTVIHWYLGWALGA